MKCFLIAFFLFLIPLGACTSQVEEVGSSMYRGNPARTGTYDTRPLLAFPQVKWSIKAGLLGDSDPVISGGTLFFAMQPPSPPCPCPGCKERDEDSDLHGTCDFFGYFGVSELKMQLYAVCAHTGEIKWTLEIDDSECTPAIHDGTVFFGEWERFYAVDASTAEVIWHVEIVGYCTSPVVDSGAVYFASGGVIYALDIHTGKEKWRFVAKDDEDKEEFYTVFQDDPEEPEFIMYNYDFIDEDAAVAVQDNSIVFGTSGKGIVYSIDSETGIENWRFETNSCITSTPCIGLGAVFIGTTEGDFYSIDLVSGELRWKVELKAPITSSPAISDGIVYIGTRYACPHGNMYSAGPGHLYALDAETGEQQWAFKAGGFVGSPVIAGEVLYVACGSSRGVRPKLHALHPTSGDQIWELQTRSMLTLNSPAIHEGVLFILQGRDGRDGFVQALH